MYELVQGNAPFTGNNPKEIGSKIIARKIKYSPKCTPEYIDLVDKILQSDPAKRIPLIKVFDHPWVKFFEGKYNLKKQPSV